MAKMPSPAEVVEQYFDAWTSKDFETARSLLSDDLSFIGPLEQFDDADAADEWRAAMRHACRAEHLRIRTFLGPAAHGEDGRTKLVVYVHHRDHVITNAERRAAAEAMEDLVAGRPTVPFSQRVLAARRKMIRVVNGDTDQESPSTWAGY